MSDRKCRDQSVNTIQPIILTKLATIIDYRNSQFSLRHPVAHLHHQTILMNLESRPQLSHSSDLKGTNLFLERLNAFSYDHPTFVPTTQILRFFQQNSSHHETILIQIVPVTLVDLIFKQGQLSHNNLGKKQIQLIPRIILQRYPKFNLLGRPIFGLLVIGDPKTALVIFINGLDLTDLLQFEPATTVNDDQLTILERDNHLFTSTLVLEQTTQLVFTRPVAFVWRTETRDRFGTVGLKFFFWRRKPLYFIWEHVLRDGGDDVGKLSETGLEVCFILVNHGHFGSLERCLELPLPLVRVVRLLHPMVTLKIFHIVEIVGDYRKKLALTVLFEHPCNQIYILTPL